MAHQAVEHFQQQNYSDTELHEVFDTHGTELARLIHAQMMEHFWEQASSYEAKISRGFTQLKACNYTYIEGQAIHSLRETLTETSRIKQILFGGFNRCLYPLQKFDSDTERRFALLLERDALKWFKPAKGQFQIYYRSGTEQPEYIPDFVAELEDVILMAETKARTDLQNPEVEAKSRAAAGWCTHATAYSKEVGGKPWKYLLIPHDEVNEAKRLVDFLRYGVNS